jgi:hypothetical protein
LVGIVAALLRPASARETRERGAKDFMVMDSKVKERS